MILFDFSKFQNLLMYKLKLMYFNNSTKDAQLCDLREKLFFGCLCGLT